jgi:hypothetical protein
MRIFVTGASGWIGSAVVPELVAAGHQVVGLARSDTSAGALAAAGAEVQLGTLDDLDVLLTAAAGSDGVIHLAFKHELAFSGASRLRPRPTVSPWRRSVTHWPGRTSHSSSLPGCSASPRVASLPRRTAMVSIR